MLGSNRRMSVVRDLLLLETWDAVQRIHLVQLFHFIPEGHPQKRQQPALRVNPALILQLRPPLQVAAVTL